MPVMLGFQFVKWFWNLWDHLLVIIICNLAFLLGVGGLLYLLQLLQPYLSWPVLVLLAGLGLFGLALLLHAFALINYSIAKWERSNWLESLKKSVQGRSLLAAALSGICFLVVGAVLLFSWRFYSEQGSLWGTMALGLLFWLVLFALISIGYYLPMLVREEFRVRCALRKAAVVSLDNVWLSLISALVAAILATVSLLPPLMLFFGPLGLGLWYEVSLRILYYKYQYLEQLAQEQPSAEGERRKRPAIPWPALLHEQKQRIGLRSWRNFFFPWKD